MAEFKRIVRNPFTWIALVFWSYSMTLLIFHGDQQHADVGLWTSLVAFAGGGMVIFDLAHRR